MLQEFRRDVARYKVYEDRWLRLVLTPELWFIFWYRLGYWIYSENKIAIVKAFLGPLYFLGSLACEVFAGMRIDPSAKIGPGLYIGHCGGIRLNASVTIGDNCSLTHNVTIGTAGLGRQGSPQIGNDVYIGTGATLIGLIRIGDGAKIGANTLVNRSVPAGATIVGVPGVILDKIDGKLRFMCEAHQ